MRLLAAVAFALLMLVSCAESTVMRGGVEMPTSQAVAEDLARITDLMGEGRYPEARDRLERFLVDFPTSRRTDEALLLLGDANLELGDEERAAAAWRRVIDDYPRAPRAGDTRYRLARLYRDLGRVAAAREVLGAANFGRADEELRRRMYRLLADLARDERDYPDTVRWLAYVRRESSSREDVFGVDLELEELVEDRLLDRELSELVDEVPSGPVRDQVLLELARRALERGDPERATDVLARLPSSLRPADEAARARLLERARTESIEVGRELGLVVPLTGPYAVFGESVLRGVLLALSPFGTPPGPYRLHVRDSRGDPDGAADAVEELAREGVSAVIGPLRSTAAASAAARAQQLGVPLLTLSRREDLPFLGDYIFRLGLTPSDQVRVLIEHSVEVCGYSRFAVLYPSDEYGTSFKNLFWDEVERMGAEVVGAESYEPEAVDYQTPIKKLVGLYYLTEDDQARMDERDRLARHPEENADQLADPNYAELPPFVDFDALFVPDGAAVVGLILPQLRFYEIRDVALLGPSEWNDPELLEIAGRHARGAVFTDTFFARSQYPFVKEFVSAYFREYGEEPDRLAAEAYDAASILRSLLDSGRSVSREGLRRSLLRVREFPGVSGVTSFDNAGGMRKALYLLTVEGNRIVELDGLPCP